MKKLLILVVIVISGCASNKFVATDDVYEHSLLDPQNGNTKIRVHRLNQISGAALGKECPLVLKVDEKEVAGLQQNQYVDFYVPNGEHTLSVRFKCAFTAWRKSIDLIADGAYQEYQTETGAAGQYRMWRIK
ncbi:hypothetical protein WM46_04745 [Citrobacter freundii complex sp. CFNIH2]|uniref:hypothetical protein n=1 Tax=Citrobacter freundii complex sp. CFNIH2 TaxID=2066049 RepID=UPI000C8695E7|nr:hypothetical protein [Citrobacter freundii complex sp. CFNIH2]AUO64120.1 hypothetical protein WM46_04745 [Citrobacter freundii complex sp. CFNIH2]